LLYFVDSEVSPTRSSAGPASTPMLDDLRKAKKRRNIGFVYV